MIEENYQNICNICFYQYYIFCAYVCWTWTIFYYTRPIQILAVVSMWLVTRRGGVAATTSTHRAHTNDIIIICEKFEGVVSARVQHVLKLVERWCQREGLNVNFRDATAVPFSWRNRLHKVRCSIAYGYIILISANVKYLGDILDIQIMPGACD